MKRPVRSPMLGGLSIEQRSSMATRIRLKKVGRKKQASFRIVVAGSMHARGGRVTETIGKYNPRTYPSYVEIDAGRALHWLREGAQMSESVSALFRQTGILKQYADGADAEGVVVIGDPQGKTRLADRTGGAQAAAVKAEPEVKTAKAEPKAKTAKAEPEAKTATAEPEAEAAAAEPVAEEEQDAES